VAEKRPAFQWYPKDYLSDENVALMTLEQEGAYTRLLNYCWLQGSIPSDIDALARLCRVSAEDMDRIWPGVEKCFQGRGERLTHGRLEKERRKQSSYRDAKKAAGVAGAKARWEKEENGSATDLPLANDSFAVCSLQFASSTAVNDDDSSSNQPAPEPRTRTSSSPDLKTWLGEYNGCLNGLDNITQLAWFGTWGPTGTDAGIWQDIAPERQPPIMATAILAWAAASTTGRFHRGFCRKVLSEAISDAITADRIRDQAQRDSHGTDELRTAAAQHDTLEVARLNTEGQHQATRQQQARAWYDSQPPDTQQRVRTAMEQQLRKFGPRPPALIAAAALADAVDHIRHEEAA